MMAGRDTIGVVGGPAGHIPVLLDEVIELADPRPGQVFVDGTFGDGGYSRALLAAGASVVAIDRDPDAIAEGRPLVTAAKGRLTLLRGRFGALDWAARGAGYDVIDGVVLDVGVSSMQLERSERGFSFLRDGPLDMRMSKEGPTAADLVNQLDPKALSRIIATLGEEKLAGLVSRAIAEVRNRGPITRTKELATIIEDAIGRRHNDQIHPATRTFQALRIAVNHELEELAEALGAAERILRENGRLAVATFHSLEDRVVKRFFSERSRESSPTSRHLPPPLPGPQTFVTLTRRPVIPNEAEQAQNPRSRSAKLRAAARTGAPAHPVDPNALGVPVVHSLREPA